MILKQNEINEIADEYEYTDGIYGFKEGVKWAESKFEEVIIDFGVYCYIAARNPNDDTLTFEELFQKFIKWKNKKHDNTL